MNNNQLFVDTPSHWQTAPIKHLCDRAGEYGANESAESYTINGARFIRTSDILDDGSLTEEGVYLPPEKVADYLLKPGDFLISRSGTVGRAFIYESRWGLCAYAGYLVRFVFRHNQDPRFYFYLTKSPTFHNWLGTATIEATIGNVNAEKYSNLVVPVPPLSEQRSIADYLDRETAKLDTLIAAKERLLDLLAEKRRALLTHVVTRGINSNAPMRDSGIEWLGEIPEHWEITRIKHLAYLGNGSTPLRDNEEYWQDGIFPWLTSTVVNDDVIGEPTQFVTEIALHECHLPIVQPNSVLVAITGQGKTRGKAAILPYRATINQHLSFISPQTNLIRPEFLQLYLSGFYEILRMISEGTGSTKGALTIEQLAEFPVPLLPISEQDQIISNVALKKEHLDLLAQAVEDTVKLLQGRRLALIASAVSGKIWITQ
jgi:type I restriction enzyme, S subunit